jgi:drug/metabolite transporter (DMT)-like permease
MSSGALGILLALATTLCWSVLDALRKRLGQRMSAVAAVGALITGGTLPFLGMLLVRGVPDAPPASIWGYILGSILLNIVANLLFLQALQISPLGLTIPYLAFSPVFILLGGAVFLGQVPAPAAAAGMLLVVAGAMGLNPRVEGRRFNPFVALRQERGSLYMLVVALLWSIGPLLDRRGVELGGVTLYALLTNLGGGLPLLIWVALKQPGELERIRRALPLLGGTVLVLALAMSTQFLSWDYLFVAYTDAIKRGGGMLFSTLLGHFFFGEQHLRQRLPAVAVMGAGVAIVLIGG